MSKHRARPAVLVVDDEPRMLDSIRDLLEEDFDVETSTSGEQALKLVGLHDMAVIIADQRMPGLTGDEFFARAKEVSAATRILITGYADINALIRAVNQGSIYTYISKPWDPHQLRVTVTKAAEHWELMREVMRERDLLHALMDNIPDAIWFTDRTGRLTRVNQAMAELLGVENPETVIGKTILDSLAPGSAFPPDREHIFRLDGRRTLKTHRVGRSDGTTRWMSTVHVPIRENGRILAYVGASRDITEQVLAEQALRESEERYRQIVETAEEGIWILDEQHRTIFANPKMAQMLGVTVAEMRGTTPAQFMMEPDRAIQMKRFVENGSPAAGSDVRLLGRDGKLLWVIVASSPLADDAGRRRGTLAMLTDVTERKLLEERYQRAQKLEAIGRLAGGVAHDFNNVLTVISGYSHLLRKPLENSPLRAHVEKIQTAADHAAHITRQLLTFSRRQPGPSEVLDLNTAITAVLELIAPLVGEDVTVTTRLDPRAGCVRADGGQIEQVLMNLVVNARDAMPHGGTLTIETSTQELPPGSQFLTGGMTPGRYVRLLVSDTGCGMDAATLARIFEPFFSTKMEGHGTGLGLPTIHGIVSQLGGCIDVSSATAGGTTFQVFLPAAEQEQPTPLPGGEPAEQAQRGRGTILVVEDVEPLRELMQETLEPNGYTVVTAGDGAEALAICEKYGRAFDLVITDIVMPKMTGTELAVWIRQLYPSSKLLFMTGYAAGDAPCRGAAEPYIEKPFTSASLLGKVREVLEG